MSPLIDGQSFVLTLNIADLYTTNGENTTVYWRVVEGDGERYQLDYDFKIYLLPRSDDPCELDSSAPGCESSSGFGMTIVYVAGGAILIVGIVAVTLIFRSRGKDDVEDSVEQFGGVQQMDPVEAYVQQMVGQGYAEADARQYAEQYYASYYAQQGKGGGS
jgi:hypothetical protein